MMDGNISRKLRGKIPDSYVVPASMYGLENGDGSSIRTASTQTIWACLDIGLWQPLARGASESENPLAPQKTLWPPKNM